MGCDRCVTLEADLRKRLKKSVVHAERIQKLEAQVEGYSVRVEMLEAQIDRAKQTTLTTIMTVDRIRKNVRAGK